MARKTGAGRAKPGQTADTLRVRVYNVRFGDAILISVPDRGADGVTTPRHILIDVGNAAAGAGGENEVFAPVVQDILHQLDGRPLDLYIMTHEHMDHIQGLLWAAKNMDIGLAARLGTRHAWLTKSAEPGYYATHPDAKKKFDLARGLYMAIQQRLAAVPRSELPPDVQVLLANNNRFALDEVPTTDGTAASIRALNGASSGDCVAYLRALTLDPASPDEDRSHYVWRSVGPGGTNCDLTGKHPFTEAKLALWGPEENTARYYGGFKPLNFGMAEMSDILGGARPPLELRVQPPAGVDAGAFYALASRVENGIRGNLLAIDKAANNTSLVLHLEWRGWRLLFPADAEIESWGAMRELGVLGPVDFLKVGHHSSHNGTPADATLKQLVPAGGAIAAVTTYPGVYNGIPHCPTLRRLRDAGCTVYSTQALNSDGAESRIDCSPGVVTLPPADAAVRGPCYYEFTFPAGGPSGR